MMNNILKAMVSLLLTIAIIINVGTGKVRADSLIELTFTDEEIEETASGNGYSISGTNLTIKSAGTYVISGSCQEGSISVAKGISDVIIILKDLSLTSSSTAPISIKKGSAVTLHLEGKSFLTDNEDPSEEETNSDFEGACIKVKSGSSLTFCGEGTLNIYGNAKNGIKGGAEAKLVFNNGYYYVEALNNGIASDGNLIINQGSYVIKTDNDGIKSVPDETDTESVGSIEINGGTFDIQTQGDAIQAETLLSIYGGKFNIQTMNGYDDVNFDADTMSCKGLKASGDRTEAENSLKISGGEFVINTADDAVHSDGSVVVTGGTFVIQTGDDGVHAEDELILGMQGGYERDPELTIQTSYEGLEGSSVTVFNGKYRVVSSDDGINSAGGSSNGSGGGGWEFGPGSPSAGNYHIYVYGGSIYVDALGDGMDANGNMYLYGGSQTVFSQGQGGDNSPLDTDGTILIKGATVFAAGTNPMNETPSSSSQKYTVTKNRFNANSKISVKDGSNLIYNDTLLRRSDYILFSSPSVSDTVTFEIVDDIDSCHGNAWDHDWDEGVTVSESDDDSEGLIVYTCSRCNAKEYKTVVKSANYKCDKHGLADDENLPFITILSVSNSTKGITIQWDSDSSCDMYEIWRNSSDSWEKMAESLETNYTDSSVKGMNGYQYRIRGYLKEKSAFTEYSEEKSIVYYPFNDVPSSIGNTTYKAILWAYENGIVKGTSDTTYSPEDSCTRAQLCVMLWRLKGKPAINASNNPFSDVSASLGNTTYKSILWAYQEGIVKGKGEGQFDPNGSTTRANMAVMLWRLAGKPAVNATNNPFTDVTPSLGNTTYKAILWAYDVGLTKGTTATTFSPEQNCTRAQLAVFLYRFSDIYG